MTIAQSEIHELEQFRATLIELKSQTDKEVVIFDGIEVNIKDKKRLSPVSVVGYFEDNYDI